MIVGWNLSDTLDTTYVLQAVREAVQNTAYPELLTLTRAVSSQARNTKSYYKDLNIRQSMDGKSRWADNIMIERWFRSLKTEEIYINEYANPKELRRAIGKYVEQYNHLRPHAALDNEVPSVVYFNVFSSQTADLDNLSLAG